MELIKKNLKKYISQEWGTQVKKICDYWYNAYYNCWDVEFLTLEPGTNRVYMDLARVEPKIFENLSFSTFKNGELERVKNWFFEQKEKK